MERARAGWLVVGAGVGALADGIVLHQLLQWHHLWSSRTSDETVAGLEENTLADGIFHATFLAVLVAGVVLVAGRPLAARLAAGLALVGWGLFHAVDQIVFHLALDAHHIREGADPEWAYDWGFFAIGAALALAGLALVRGGGRAHAEPRRRDAQGRPPGA